MRSGIHRTLHEKIDTSAQDMDGKREVSFQTLNEKIDASGEAGGSFQTLNEKIDASDGKREVSFQTLNDKIDTSVQMLRDENAAS